MDILDVCFIFTKYPKKRNYPVALCLTLIFNIVSHCALYGNSHVSYTNC